MTRRSLLFTVLNLALFMAVVAAIMFGWQPDVMTGFVALALIIVVLDVALVVVLWRRRQE